MVKISVRDLSTAEQVFYLDSNKKIKYNKLCESCPHECKQSFRADLIECKKSVQAKTKTEYLAEINKSHSSLAEFAKKIKVHSKTLKSTLESEDRDIDFDMHHKLMKELFGIDITEPQNTKRKK